MNRLDAARLLARRYPGGIEALAHRMAKRPDTLCKELAGAPGYKFGVGEEEDLVAWCQAAGVQDPLAPLTAAAAAAGALLIPLPAAGGGDVASMQALATAAREFAEFMAVVAQAHADGAVTANELRRIEREASELMAGVQQCIVAARVLHEAGKPAHMRAAEGGAQ